MSEIILEIHSNFVLLAVTSESVALNLIFKIDSNEYYSKLKIREGLPGSL